MVHIFTFLQLNSESDIYLSILYSVHQQVTVKITQTKTNANLSGDELLASWYTSLRKLLPKAEVNLVIGSWPVPAQEEFELCGGEII